VRFLRRARRRALQLRPRGTDAGAPSWGAQRGRVSNMHSNCTPSTSTTRESAGSHIAKYKIGRFMDHRDGWGSVRFVLKFWVWGGAQWNDSKHASGAAGHARAVPVCLTLVALQKLGFHHLGLLQLGRLVCELSGLWYHGTRATCINFMYHL
jgi:hypothetical protein